MAVCYRHPDRETGVSCSNCGKPICPDCMTATPVGMRCPDCSRQRTKTRTVGTMRTDPMATYVIIGICVVLWLGQLAGGGRIYQDLALVAGVQNPFTGQVDIGVAHGDWWRIVTGGFLHDQGNPLHILFNMYILYWLGGLLEPTLGRARFVALYGASLLAGALGAVVAVPA